MITVYFNNYSIQVQGAITQRQTNNTFWEPKTEILQLRIKRFTAKTLSIVYLPIESFHQSLSVQKQEETIHLALWCPDSKPNESKQYQKVVYFSAWPSSCRISLDWSNIIKTSRNFAEPYGKWAETSENILFIYFSNSIYEFLVF